MRTKESNELAFSIICAIATVILLVAIVTGTFHRAIQYLEPRAYKPPENQYDPSPTYTLGY